MNFKNCTIFYVIDVLKENVRLFYINDTSSYSKQKTFHWGLSLNTKTFGPEDLGNNEGGEGT